MKALISSLLLIFVSTSAFSAEEVDPKKMLTGVADNIISYMKTNQAKVIEQPNLAKELVRRELLPYVDEIALGRRVLAKHWKAATSEQQTKFVENFVDLVIDTYAKGLSQYDGQVFTFEDTEYNSKRTTARVKSEMKQNDGAPIRIDYLLKQPKGLNEWRVVDVSIEGISMVGSYRNQFGLQIEKDGLDSVIKKLANKEIDINISK